MPRLYLRHDYTFVTRIAHLKCQELRRITAFLGMLCQQNERYVGTFFSKRELMLERFSASRDVFIHPTTQFPKGWTALAIIARPRSTAIYINGNLADCLATVDADRFSLETILGSNGGLFQLGKANWTNEGEFFGGLIDNVRIYAKFNNAFETKEEN